MATRQAPPTDDARAVFPGTPGGKFTPLTESECQSVYDTALDLLENHGHG